MVEFLERLGVGFRTEQWVVRSDGVVRNAHVHVDEDVAWLREVEAHTKPWLGFSHPRVAEVHEISWARDHLVIVVGDERGPSFVRAAKQLDDPREREAWAVAELIAISEALAAMTRHQPGLVHQRTYDQLIVGADGHARLRAPIAFVQAYKPGTYLGRGNSIGSLWGMSPEQVIGAGVTPASDVFSLATILYTAIALHKPFGGTTDFDTLTALRDAVLPKPPPSTADVWAILKRAFAKAPAARYPTPAAFADALRTAGDATPPASALARLSASNRNSGPAPSESAGIMGKRCTKRWDGLTPTATDGIRYCGECKHEVTLVRSLEAVIPLLGQRCIAYRPE
jgi:hypothetical protein